MAIGSCIRIIGTRTRTRRRCGLRRLRLMVRGRVARRRRRCGMRPRRRARLLGRRSARGGPKRLSVRAGRRRGGRGLVGRTRTRNRGGEGFLCGVERTLALSVRAYTATILLFRCSASADASQDSCSLNQPVFNAIRNGPPQARRFLLFFFPFPGCRKHLHYAVLSNPQTRPQGLKFKPQIRPFFFLT